MQSAAFYAFVIENNYNTRGEVGTLRNTMSAFSHLYYNILLLVTIHTFEMVNL